VRFCLRSALGPRQNLRTHGAASPEIIGSEAAFELATGKLRFVAERAVPILYKGMALDAKYRIDLLIREARSGVASPFLRASL
jgi:hypothetical protein